VPGQPASNPRFSDWDGKGLVRLKPRFAGGASARFLSLDDCSAREKKKLFFNVTGGLGRSQAELI
jgi:hypothetical protein